MKLLPLPGWESGTVKDKTLAEQEDSNVWSVASHVSNGRALGEAIELWLLTFQSHLTVETQLVSSFSEACWLV